jgi:hypothetical protein
MTVFSPGFSSGHIQQAAIALRRHSMLYPRAYIHKHGAFHAEFTCQYIQLMPITPLDFRERSSSNFYFNSDLQRTNT